MTLIPQVFSLTWNITPIPRWGLHKLKDVSIIPQACPSWPEVSLLAQVHLSSPNLSLIPTCALIPKWGCLSHFLGLSILTWDFCLNSIVVYWTGMSAPFQMYVYWPRISSWFQTCAFWHGDSPPSPASMSTVTWDISDSQSVSSLTWRVLALPPELSSKNRPGTAP